MKDKNKTLNNPELGNKSKPPLALVALRGIINNLRTKYMTREEQVQIELKKAEINYSAVWRVSNEVFTKKASEALNMPIERVEVRRNIMMGNNFGTLHVIVYDDKDEERAYYRLAKHYEYLPSNIFEFERALAGN